MNASQMFSFQAVLLVSVLAVCDLHAYDLKTAEGLYIDKNFDMKAADARVRLKYATVSQHYGVLLPSVDITSTFVPKAPPEYSLKVNFGVPYPSQWSLEHDVLNNHKSISMQEQSQTRKESIGKFRKLYFRAKNLEKKQRDLEEMLVWVRQFRKESQDRFAKGYISEIDASRAHLQLIETEESLGSLREETSAAKKELATLMGVQDNLASFVLDTDLVLDPKYFTLTKEQLQALVPADGGEQVAIKKLHFENAKLQSESNFYKYLPRLSLSAELPVPQSDRGNVYMATLSWNLFSGGSDFFEGQKAFYSESQAREEFQAEAQKFATARETLILEFLDARSKYLVQQKTLEIAKKIVANSRSRFSSGMMSAMDLSQDMQTYLRHATSLNDMGLRLVSLGLDLFLL